MDVAIYYALVSLVFLFKAILAFLEDFPGAVEKPHPVWGMDLAIAIADLIFMILVTRKPDLFEYWHAATGITGFASKLGRAYMVAAYTSPLTPVLTPRDRFNAFAPRHRGWDEERVGLNGLAPGEISPGGSRGAVCVVRRLRGGAQ